MKTAKIYLDQIKENIGWACSTQENRKTYKILVGHLKGRELRTARRRCKYNIRMDLRGGWEGVDWIHLAQDSDNLRALVNTIMNLRVA
jgi:hypothetical protein